MLGFLSRFVDSNDRELKRIQPFVDEANDLEEEIKALSDTQIRERFTALRDEFRATVAARGADRRRAPPPRPGAPPRARQGAPQARQPGDPGRPRRDPARRLRHGSRGDGPHARDAPLRRAADRRGRPPPGQDRRDADRRGQDPRRAACGDPERDRRQGRPHRHGQRLPGPARPAVDGPDLPLPRPDRGHDPGPAVGRRRGVVRVRAGLPHERRASRQPATRHSARGVRGGRDLRHEQRVRLRLPPRQHGHRARGAGAARALPRHRRRGRQHPHRRGANTADHQRPGRGVGRPVLHVRAPRPQAPRAPRRLDRRRRPRWRLLHRPQGQGRLTDGGGRRSDREAARGREHLRRRSSIRPPLRAGASRARALQARPGLHRQGQRDHHRRRVHRAADARPALERGPPPGHRGQGGPARPARERDDGHDHVPELLPPVRQARGHDRHGDDRGRGVPQDLPARGRRHPDAPADGPRGRHRPRVPEREGQVQRRDRRDRGDAGRRAAGPRRHRVGREVGAARRAAQAPRASPTRS